MIAFRVHLNGEHVTTAGLSGHHVTSVFVDSRPQELGGDLAPWIRVSLGVSGRRWLPDGSGTHFTWLRSELSVGDSITIEVVDASEVSAPIHESPAIELTEGRERERLSYLLKKYGASPHSS
jgi:hypothetical protein